VIISRRKRWDDQMACMEAVRNAYRTGITKPDRNRLLERHRLRLEVILKWILNKQGVTIWTGVIWMRIESSNGLSLTW
jgi:hypothetical protein